MIHSTFFKNIKQRPVKFKKFKAKSPLFFQNFNLMGGLFTINYKAAQKLLPRETKPLEIVPGIALLAIHCMDYLETDIGPYAEVSVAIILESPATFLPRPLKAVLDIVARNYHVFIEDLPVTTEIARSGGVQFFKFPKYLADISFRETKTHRICTLRDKKNLDLILEFDMKKLKTTHVRQDKNKDLVLINTYSQKKAPGFRGRLKVNLKERGFSFLIPYATLRLGEHEISKKINSLKPGILLQALYAPHCEGILFHQREIQAES